VFEAGLAVSPDIIDIHDAFDPLALELVLGAATGKPRCRSAARRTRARSPIARR